MNFGMYYIGQDFSEIAEGLTEISKDTYAIMKCIFEDEKIYNAKDITYCDTTWKTVIGVTQNKVYKISLQTPDTPIITVFLGLNLWEKVFDKLKNAFSNFSEQKEIGYSKLTIWDTSWGNIILNRTFIPYETIESPILNIILDITATGSFAFKKENVSSGGCMGTLLILAGLTISMSILFLVFIFKSFI